MEPRDLDYETMSMTLANDPHDGINSWLQPPVALMADGSVEILPFDTQEAELRGMLLISDGMGLAVGTAEIEDGRDRPLKDSSAANLPQMP